MRSPNIFTVQEHIAWSYANLARAHAALLDKADKYERTHHIIRTRLFYGLTSGRLNYRSMFDDERVKLVYPVTCSYCGDDRRLSLDHLIPRSRTPQDNADNLVWACRRCNSSKGNRDLLAWMQSNTQFPSILLLRRYIKLAVRFCEQADIMKHPLAEAKAWKLPVEISRSRPSTRCKFGSV